MNSEAPAEHRDAELSRRLQYIMEQPLGEVRAELNGLPDHSRGHAARLAILLLLIDMNNKERAKFLAMLRTIYFTENQ